MIEKPYKKRILNIMIADELLYGHSVTLTATDILYKQLKEIDPDLFIIRETFVADRNCWAVQVQHPSFNTVPEGAHIYEGNIEYIKQRVATYKEKLLEKPVLTATFNDVVIGTVQDIHMNACTIALTEGNNYASQRKRPWLWATKEDEWGQSAGSTTTSAGYGTISVNWDTSAGGIFNL